LVGQFVDTEKMYENHPEELMNAVIENNGLENNLLPLFISVVPKTPSPAFFMKIKSLPIINILQISVDIT
jgi:hypothetical protein